MVLLDPPAPAARAEDGRGAAGARRLRDGRVVMIGEVIDVTERDGGYSESRATQSDVDNEIGWRWTEMAVRCGYGAETRDRGLRFRERVGKSLGARCIEASISISI